MLHICVALLLVILPISASHISDQPKLAVSIRSMQASYRINGEVRLEVQLSNVGNSAVLIRRQLSWGFGRTEIRVFDARHKQVFTDFLADELPSQPKEADFLELRPGEFFRTFVTDSARHFVNGPGTYKFAVKYTSIVTEEWAREHLKLPDLPLWSRERGTVSSAEIPIVITK